MYTKGTEFSSAYSKGHHFFAVLLNMWWLVKWKTKMENKYFWINTNINVWLQHVTQTCPRMQEITSQRVSNFKFFGRACGPRPPGSDCGFVTCQACYASIFQFSCPLSLDHASRKFTDYNLTSGLYLIKNKISASRVSF